MYQPYPTSSQMPELGKPPVPAQVKYAVTAMYVGAAATVAGILIEILTVNATKAAIEKRSPSLTASQLNSTEHALIIGSIVSGLIAIAAWLIIARACNNGHNWARITGTVLFGLATIDTIGSAISPVAGLVKAWWPVIWLAGLVAVIFLWQRPSTDFFKGVFREDNR
jgi:F0F1-type ATP synthase membrane subunit c/vacuolar-type H+-ATPase subunit K